MRAKVRTGIKVNGRPKAIDHFRSDDPVFIEKLGEPKQLAIKLPFPTIDDTLPTGLEYWGKNQTLICWCADTVTAHRLTNEGVIETPCTHPTCQQFQAKNCVGMARFRFTIPSLGPGIFQIDTKSRITIETLMGVLLQYYPWSPDQWWILGMEKRTSGQHKYNILSLTFVPVEEETGEVPDAPEE